MAKCKLKKGDRIYECRYREATLTELITDPEVRVQSDGSAFWHWQAKIVSTGQIVEYGISETSPQYGPRLFRKNMYEVGHDKAEPILPPFDTSSDAEIEITQVSINADIEILGHVFHGLKDIEKHVEMSLYKSYSRGKADERKPDEQCDVHVGEMWMPYPCFDEEDFATENRSFRNFVFRSRPITQDDMKTLSELPSKRGECRISEDMPQDVLPLVFYVGDGDTMVVAK